MNGPIIITGAPRSGTSILGEVFEHHPAVDYRFEVFRHIFPPFATGPSRIPPHGLLSKPEADTIRSVMKGRDGRTLVVKDPQLLDHFAALRQIWPDCRVVLIERDLRDVACSVASAIENGKSPKLGAWLKTARIPEKLQSRYGRLTTRCAALCALRYRLATCGIYGLGTYRISYAGMIADPEATLFPLLDTLNIGWSGKVAEFVKTKISNDPSVHVSRRSAALFVPDHSTRVGRWEREFTDEEKRFLSETWFDYED